MEQIITWLLGIERIAGQLYVINRLKDGSRELQYVTARMHSR